MDVFYNEILSEFKQLVAKFPDHKFRIEQLIDDGFDEYASYMVCCDRCLEGCYIDGGYFSNRDELFTFMHNFMCGAMDCQAKVLINSIINS